MAYPEIYGNNTNCLFVMAIKYENLLLMHM